MREFKLDKGTAFLLSEKCVNSNYKARWLSQEDEDYCECSFGECKVKVAISYNGHPPSTYILTEQEFNNLPKEYGH